MGDGIGPATPVYCTVCGRRKKPMGRDSMDNGLCSWVSPNYERAQVFVARCLEWAGDVEQALAAYETIERRFADKAHEPTNATARAKREIAVAQSRYYHATLLLSEAVKRPADALALLEGYEDAVPGQADYHSLARLRRLEAHAQLGDAPAAEEVLAALPGEEVTPLDEDIRAHGEKDDG